MSRDVLYTPVRKGLGTLGAGLVMTATSALILKWEAGGPLVARVVGWLGLAFCVPATLVVLVRLLRPRPVLALDTEGLEMLAWPSGTARIRWDEIDHLLIMSIAGQRMVGIVPRDSDTWLARNSGAAKTLMQLNQRFGAPLWLAQSTLPGTCEEIIERMRRHRPLEVRT